MSISRWLVASLAVVVAGAPVEAQLPAADHYLCYKVRPSPGSPAFPAVQASLEDAVPPGGTFSLQKVAALCNPASVDAGAVAHPADHEVGYRLRPIKGSPAVPRRTVGAIDEFGVHTIRVQRPDVLLVPSSKALGSGGAPPYGPPAIRHYQCHRARGEGFLAPPAPSVVDQFRSVVYELRKVSRLCAPVDKNGEDPQAPSDPTHLVCYRVRGAKLSRTGVSTDNQIRPETLDAVRPVELCVPALLGPPGSTTTSSSSSSSSLVITTSTSGPSVTTTTTLPRPCGDPLSPPAPLCWGECPGATPICAATANGCECVAGSTPCGSASFPQCDGACGAGEACVVSLTLGCTCQFQGIPCAAAYALTNTCGGVCPTDYTCAGPFFTPDGDGCACVPIGSTCHLTCGADPGGGNCPPGQTCRQGAANLCLCQ